MKFRYVVRPKGILGTPKAVARELGFRVRFYPNPAKHRIFDYQRDFFMGPVAPQHVKNAPLGYGTFHDFTTRNKYGQRQALAEAGVPVPQCASSLAETQGLPFYDGLRFVVRPLRHSGGAGYRFTNNRLDFTPGEEYISEFYPKKREYRVIFVFGKPMIWLRKKPHEGVSNEEPWGHQNSRFQTIIDVDSSPLSSTDCVARLGNTDIVRSAHICAADVLFNKSHQQPYSTFVRVWTLITTGRK